MNNGDVYKMIEDRIISMLKEGKIPWQCPYETIHGHRCRCFSHGTNQPYSLLNQMVLSRPGEYWTFKQAKDAGYSIKKGSKAEKIFFWKKLVYVDGAFTPNCTDPTLRQIPYLQYYSVFHESMVEGYERPKEPKKEDITETIAEADEIVSTYLSSQDGLLFEENDEGCPSYSPSADLISCPRKVQFKSLPEYYSSLFHEMVHSTGHKKRLDRDLKNRYGSEKYSREELVAEMGSSALCAQVGILNDSLSENNAAYCAGWLEALHDDPKWIVWAASRADAAVRFIRQEDKQEAITPDEG